MACEGKDIRKTKDISIFKLLKVENKKHVKREILLGLLLKKCNKRQKKFLTINNQYIYSSIFPEKEIFQSLLGHLIFDSLLKSDSNDFSTEFSIHNFMEITQIDDFDKFLDELVNLNIKWERCIELRIVDSLFFSFRFL